MLQAVQFVREPLQVLAQPTDTELGLVQLFLTTFPVLQVWQPQVDPEPLEAELHPITG